VLGQKDARIGLRQPDLYEPPRYYDYLFTTSRILADHGIRYVHAFCPNAIEMDADETKTLSRDAGELALGGSFAGLFSETRQRRRLSKRVVERAMQQSYDAMAPLRSMPSTEAFIDSCHLSKAGVKSVMNDVAAHVPEWLDARLLPMAAPDPAESPTPLRLSAQAGAPFFTIGAATRAGSKLSTNGSVGLVEASPGLNLPRGRYRARWYGRTDATVEVRSDVVGVERGVATPYGERRAWISPSPNEQLLVAVDGSLPTARENVEYRFFVESPGAKLELQQVVFEQIWDD
jgi:hypothetical protein